MAHNIGNSISAADHQKLKTEQEKQDLKSHKHFKV